MALHLNLYHEIEKQKAINRRDPLKLSLYGLAAIALGFAGYYAFQLGSVAGTRSELRRVESELATLTPKAEKAKQREEELNVAIKTSEALVERIEGRFYWAPVLDTLVKAVPREVQITKMVADVAVVEKPKAPVEKAPAAAGAKDAKTAKAAPVEEAKPVELVTITLDGLSAAQEPRRVAEEFRVSIAEHFGERYDQVTATFRTLEESPEQAVVEGVATPTATFSIVLQLQPRPASTPPAQAVAQQR